MGGGQRQSAGNSANGLLGPLGQYGIGNGRVLDAIRGYAQRYNGGYRDSGHGHMNRGGWGGYGNGYGYPGQHRMNKSDLFYGAASPYPYGGSYPYQDDGYARAIRDVGIANAVVNLVGIAATSSRYAYPAAPVVEQVVVQPPRYETYQVWIPEVYDPNTGLKIGGGYYETRTRLVSEVRTYRPLQYVPCD